MEKFTARTRGEEPWSRLAVGDSGVQGADGAETAPEADASSHGQEDE